MAIDAAGSAPVTPPYSGLSSTLGSYAELPGSTPQEKAQIANAKALQALNWAQGAVANLKTAEGKVAELQATGGPGLEDAQQALIVARGNANAMLSNAYEADGLANYAATAAGLSQVPFGKVSSVQPDAFATASSDQLQSLLANLDSAPISAPSFRAGAAAVLGRFPSGSTPPAGFSYAQQNQRAAQIAAMTPDQLAKMPTTYLVDNAGLISSNALPLDSDLRNALQTTLSQGGEANAPFFVKDGSVAAWGLGLGSGGAAGAGNLRADVEANEKAHGYRYDAALGGWTSAGGKFESARSPDSNINYSARGGIWADSSGIKMRYFNATELSALQLPVDVSQGGRLFFVPPDPTKPDQGQRFYFQRNDSQPGIDVTAAINPNTRAALAAHFEKAPVTNYATDFAKQLNTSAVTPPTPGNTSTRPTDLSNLTPAALFQAVATPGMLALYKGLPSDEKQSLEGTAVRVYQGESTVGAYSQDLSKLSPEALFQAVATPGMLNVYNGLSADKKRAMEQDAFAVFGSRPTAAAQRDPLNLSPAGFFKTVATPAQLSLYRQLPPSAQQTMESQVAALYRGQPIPTGVDVLSLSPSDLFQAVSTPGLRDIYNGLSADEKKSLEASAVRVYQGKGSSSFPSLDLSQLSSEGVFQAVATPGMLNVYNGLSTDRKLEMERDVVAVFQSRKTVASRPGLLSFTPSALFQAVATPFQLQLYGQLSADQKSAMESQTFNEYHRVG